MTLTEWEAAGILHCTVEELRTWRAIGAGPRFIMDKGAVKYNESTLLEWIGNDSGPDGYKGEETL